MTDRTAVMEVRAILGAPRHRRLFEEIRRRVEEAGFEEIPTRHEGPAEGAEVPQEPTTELRRFRARTVTLSGLSPAEREAIADLHGWPTVPGERVTVDLRKLDEALRRSRFGIGLMEALEALFGHLEDRNAIRLSATAVKERMWETAFDHPALERHPQLSSWLENLRKSGALTRAGQRWPDGPAALLQTVLRALERLPSEPPVMLQVLATELAGDAHALDPGRPLAGLLVSALAALAQDDTPMDAEERRRLWARFGVLCDALSSHVLVLGLRPRGDDPISKHLLEFSILGEPARLTLRALQRSTLLLTPGTPVHVCENPALVSLAADRLGPGCPPLVCTEGVPSLAVWQLLTALRDAGARIVFHTDFDWGGLRIGNHLYSRLGASPWRMSAEDYLEASGLCQGLPLAGAEAAAIWDTKLTPAMRERGTAVFEEQVAELLLRDIEAVSGASSIPLPLTEP